VVLHLTVCLAQWCCVGSCLVGPGRVGLGTMSLSWVFFSPIWALEFVLFCGRLAVSQYNFLFIQCRASPPVQPRGHTSCPAHRTLEEGGLHCRSATEPQNNTT
jgi:hypothetical protein